MASDALHGFSAGERAQIEALLERRSEDGHEETPVERVGPIRRVACVLVRLIGLTVVAAIGWHIHALANARPPFDAVHAPVGLTAGSGLAAILLLFRFDGRWRRALPLLFGIARSRSA